MVLQQHPDYHLGFFDAMDGDPLFEGECTAEYEAGWRAFWEVREFLTDPDFIGSVREQKLPADAHQVRPH